MSTNPHQQPPTLESVRALLAEAILDVVALRSGIDDNYPGLPTAAQGLHNLLLLLDARLGQLGSTRPETTGGATSLTGHLLGNLLQNPALFTSPGNSVLPAETVANRAYDIVVALVQRLRDEKRARKEG